MPFRILSIDGGGIRGIIPALVLTEIERRADRRISAMFDLIAGTSTGGMLALGLAAPDQNGGPLFRAEELVALYERDGPRIFDRNVWHRVRSAAGVAEEKYPSRGINRVLEARFGQTLLSEALTDVLVTAYDIERREPHFFKSSRARTDPCRDFLMFHAARATAAAPTYFEPARIRSRAGDDPISLVDGGVFANNPAACALVEAICDHGADPTDIVILSLGTGELTRPIPHREAASWGLAKWVRPVLNVVFDGVSDTVDYQVTSIMNAVAGPGSYLRIQTTLHEGNDDMDDAGTTNLRVLRLLAESTISRYSDDLDAMIERLGRRAPAGSTNDPASLDSRDVRP